MNKSELHAKVAKAIGITLDQSNQAVNATLDAIRQSITAGEDVQIVGFGTFKLKERPARVGRNPKTGESVNIGASRKVAFKNSPKFYE